jgi:hypothetical protein
VIFLNASYILGAIGFYNPSRNVQRTVYETILRGYYFLVEPQEADLYYSALGTDQEKSFLARRSYYGHKFLRRKLFKDDTIEIHKKLYYLFCISAHAEIKGLLRDFPEYNEESIEDRLKLVLSLAFGNIQMVTELFLDSLNQNLKDFVREVLKEIVIILGKQIPLFEPDKEKYQSKLRLKNGNFMDIL